MVYTYLRCLSLNTTVDIIRETFERDVLSKRQVLDFIVIVADALPTPIGFTLLYHPKRSGYIAFDGVWFNYQGGQIVLMVAFDPVTFDIMAALWSTEENGMGYLNFDGSNYSPTCRLEAGKAFMETEIKDSSTPGKSERQTFHSNSVSSTRRSGWDN